MENSFSIGHVGFEEPQSSKSPIHSVCSPNYSSYWTHLIRLFKKYFRVLFLTPIYLSTTFYHEFILWTHLGVHSCPNMLMNSQAAVFLFMRLLVPEHASCLLLCRWNTTHPLERSTNVCEAIFNTPLNKHGLKEPFISL